MPYFSFPLPQMLRGPIALSRLCVSDSELGFSTKRATHCVSSSWKEEQGCSLSLMLWLRDLAHLGGGETGGTSDGVRHTSSSTLKGGRRTPSARSQASVSYVCSGQPRGPISNRSHRKIIMRLGWETSHQEKGPREGDYHFPLTGLAPTKAAFGKPAFLRVSASAVASH